MFLLIACTLPKTPEEVVLRACRGMPGLDVDAAGQALLKDVIDTEEWALWRSSEDYGEVIDRIRLEGYGTVRANLSCRLVSIDDQGADVVRKEPDLDLLLETWDTGRVANQPRVERAYRLTLQDDGRVHLDLATHRQARDEAMVLASEQRWEEAIAALEAITTPDPMLPLWVEEVGRQRTALEEEERARIFLEDLDEELDQEPPDPNDAP